MSLGDGNGGSLSISERDAAVACFSEDEVFWDAIFEGILVGLSTIAGTSGFGRQNGKVGRNS